LTPGDAMQLRVDPTTGTVPGSRKESTHYIYIDTERLKQYGPPIYLSTAGAYLTRGPLPISLLQTAVRRNGTHYCDFQRAGATVDTPEQVMTSSAKAGPIMPSSAKAGSVMSNPAAASSAASAAGSRVSPSTSAASGSASLGPSSTRGARLRDRSARRERFLEEARADIARRVKKEEVKQEVKDEVKTEVKEESESDDEPPFVSTVVVDPDDVRRTLKCIHCARMTDPIFAFCEMCYLPPISTFATALTVQAIAARFGGAFSGFAARGYGRDRARSHLGLIKDKATKHLRGAKSNGFPDILSRWNGDERYRANMQAQGLTSQTIRLLSFATTLYVPDVPNPIGTVPKPPRPLRQAHREAKAAARATAAAAAWPTTSWTAWGSVAPTAGAGGDDKGGKGTKRGRYDVAPASATPTPPHTADSQYNTTPAAWGSGSASSSSSWAWQGRWSSGWWDSA
jgi:hypothetical protein